MNSGDYVVIQQNKYPNNGMGHIVVIVGYDPVRGFKVKSTDENDGKEEWIPENRITWFQSIFTEEIYEAVTYDFQAPNGIQKWDQNGRYVYFINGLNVVRTRVGNETLSSVSVSLSFLCDF